MIHRLKRDSVIYAMSNENNPALFINPGDKIIVETEDCFGHKITREEQRLDDEFDFSKVNPATGPIYVQGAQPGDTLAVKIMRIELDFQGVVELCPEFGVLGDVVTECKTKIVKLENNKAIFGALSVDVMPMVGVIGVAPAGVPVPCGIPGKHGGNLDTLEITEGSIIRLPVFVEGGLLALGDVHALMGQGEVCGTGVETRALVVIIVELEKDNELKEPVVETDKAIYFLSSDKLLENAVKKATEYAVDHIAQRRKLSFEEAYMLASIACDLQISQVVNPLKTVKVKVPKTIL
ncbi:acetamidase/formamidase family protein [Kosmotoga pacifica]|uniref:Acetamidase n=1 Tax=Kosmotoga pacifica TaxID=1330330 RepID=A0A0G2ZDF4_9BACT|nr:acetamidase/formamidase family protein [Kosmotoga pacifica]AKI96843.1 hypothetical protein IX53_02295 [Kosmotoga pacifica]